jgi:hypothetical protein
MDHVGGQVLVREGTGICGEVIGNHEGPTNSSFIELYHTGDSGMIGILLP